jgi:hypothetical protein
MLQRKTWEISLPWKNYKTDFLKRDEENAKLKREHIDEVKNLMIR